MTYILRLLTLQHWFKVKLVGLPSIQTWVIYIKPWITALLWLLSDLIQKQSYSFITRFVVGFLLISHAYLRDLNNPPSDYGIQPTSNSWWRFSYHGIWLTSTLPWTIKILTIKICRCYKIQSDVLFIRLPLLWWNDLVVWYILVKLVS